MKILIAEDNMVSNRFLKMTIEKWGHEVMAVENGQEAWDLLQNNAIQMVITDWIMPKMDGLELCRKIRTTNMPHYIYLILLTAKDTTENLIDGFNTGADDFVTKPVDPSELKARVQAGKRIIELEESLKKSQIHLLQSEKMASIGQLAAGVAHEINNPTGFISSNLNTLAEYDKDIGSLITEYRNVLASIEEVVAPEEKWASIAKKVDDIHDFERKIDLEFILEDVQNLIKESQEGTYRIKKIVLALKDFAHPGDQIQKFADVNQNIDSTLNIVWNELKYTTEVIKEYGDLPEVKCYPQQLNQVFMNILVNAAQAIKGQGKIKVETKQLDDEVEIIISDTGVGIPQENLKNIFDPFFTTKDVGKGTGLGLNVAYNIIKKHNGSIDVESVVGKGTTFIIRIPVGDS